jgi:hypothetical protein
VRLPKGRVVWALAALLAPLVLAGCPPNDGSGGASPAPVETSSRAGEVDLDRRVEPLIADLQRYLDGYARARRELGESYEAEPLRRKGKSLYLDFERGSGTRTATWRIRERDGSVSLVVGNDEARAIAGTIGSASP